ENSLIIFHSAFPLFQPQRHSSNQQTKNSQYRQTVNNFHLRPSSNRKPQHSQHIEKSPSRNKEIQSLSWSMIFRFLFCQIGRISKGNKILLIKSKCQNHENKVNNKSNHNL